MKRLIERRKLVFKRVPETKITIVPSWKLRLLQWAFKEEFDDMKPDIILYIQTRIDESFLQGYKSKYQNDKIRFAEKSLAELGYFIESHQPTIGKADMAELIRSEDIFEIQEKIFGGKVFRELHHKFNLKKL